MSFFKKPHFLLFIILCITINTNAQISPVPLIEDQKPLVNDIVNLLDLNSITHDLCSVNVFKCHNVSTTSTLVLGVGEISISNVPEGKSYTIEDLSPFASSLEYLYISDEKVTISDSFWNTIDQFTKLRKIRVNKQSSNIASASFPSSLNEIIIDNYGGEVSEIFFNSNLESLGINGTLTGFSYGFTEFPVNSKLTSLYLVADTVIPTGFKNLLSIMVFSLKIDNKKDTALTIPNEFDSFPKLISLAFLFTTDNPVFSLPSSVLNIKSMKSLYITGNGFASPSTGSFYDFTINENIRFDFNGLTNFLSCTAKPCIKVNENSRFSTVGSSYSTSNIDFTNFVSIHISGNTIEQPLPEINLNTFIKAEFINSQFIGAIPDDFCNIPFEKYSFANNKLTSIPNCLVCASSFNQGSTLSPNSFSVAVPPSTPCLFQKTFKRSTIGGISSFTITGDGLGFETNEPITKRTSVAISPVITMDSVNTQVTVQTFPGEGSANLYIYQLTGTQYEITVSYDAPTINDYSFDDDTLIITGTGYSIINRNIVNITNPNSGKTVSVNVTSSDGISLSFDKNIYNDIGIRALKLQVFVADQGTNQIEIIDQDYPSSSSTLSPILILNIIVLLSLLFIYY